MCVCERERERQRGREREREREREGRRKRGEDGQRVDGKGHTAEEARLGDKGCDACRISIVIVRISRIYMEASLDPCEGTVGLWV